VTACEDGADTVREGTGIDELRRAYLDAVIEVTAPDGTVTTYAASSEPPALPDGATWLHVITACNPRSEPLPDVENEHRNRALARDLADAGLSALPAVGRSPDGTWIERSFAVVDGDEAVVLDLAARHDQHAIYRVTPTDVEVVWTTPAQG
jgi:hypothetical protein